MITIALPKPDWETETLYLISIDVNSTDAYEHKVSEQRDEIVSYLNLWDV